MSDIQMFLAIIYFALALSCAGFLVILWIDWLISKL